MLKRTERWPFATFQYDLTDWPHVVSGPFESSAYFPTIQDQVAKALWEVCFVLERHPRRSQLLPRVEPRLAFLVGEIVSIGSFGLEQIPEHWRSFQSLKKFWEMVRNLAIAASCPVATFEEYVDARQRHEDYEKVVKAISKYSGFE